MDNWGFPQYSSNQNRCRNQHSLQCSPVVLQCSTGLFEDILPLSNIPLQSD